MRERRKGNKMKEEKFIAILEDGVIVNGVKQDEVVPRLVDALVQVFHDKMGPINCTAAGKKIIDVLMEARMMERLNVLWDLVVGDDDEDDDDEDDED